MGDLPLRTPTDRWLGGPLPRRLPNRTHPHPLAMNLWYKSDVLNIQHRVLIRLSPGYALLRGRLDTRYSPVRRSPSEIASYPNDATRLACVKPVASVHPEPGSNSPLYKISLFHSQESNLCHRTTIQILLEGCHKATFTRIKRFVSSTQVLTHHKMKKHSLLVLLLSM